MAAVLTLPEICEECRREVGALERVVVLLTDEEKRAARVSFRESVEGVRCMDCAPDGEERRDENGRSFGGGRSS